MSEIIRFKDGKRTEAKPPPVERVVVVTPAQDKLFWFVLGVFCGCNWLAFMVATLFWMRMAMVAP